MKNKQMKRKENSQLANQLPQSKLGNQSLEDSAQLLVVLLMGYIGATISSIKTLIGMKKMMMLGVRMFVNTV